MSAVAQSVASYDIVVLGLGNLLRRDEGLGIRALKQLHSRYTLPAEDAARLHFEILTKGTPIEGATLTISWLPAQYQCISCLIPFESETPPEQTICPRCGGIALEIEHRGICYVTSIDVVDDEIFQVSSVLEGASEHGVSG